MSALPSRPPRPAPRRPPGRGALDRQADRRQSGLGAQESRAAGGLKGPGSSAASRSAPRRRLETTDARDRDIEVVEVDLRSAPVLIGDTPIVETCINSCFANGALIVPTGGTGADDLAALDALREIVADHEVVGVPCPVIGYGGGGIHCITQQVPQV
jgi:agmatine deiminase